ncbi:uncharacterized protein MELLADRAFT_90449 [Melampsora larici-populina 98AG31]|uniref:Uracil-DNA glycosylase-like domain-containing protein n=1 Tax=Melampsora larici-populina (strain 98AG31 / pathotype 3-4-7) TaxID=747676 RepID=F4RWZ7_MELLP|nr:uncharacterized protein MELLADRAFT_90449 [Melampsora larici-populina 98AG31]EGG03108.1 hypothetical protein MELLADRAFT_90449 [Melampsora larici-populina 98AG31]
MIELHEEIVERSHYDYSRGERPSKEDPSNHIFPPFDQLYNWSHLTPLNKVKVIILGDEPSNKPGFSHGLAYSQSITSKRILGTMNNIHNELNHQFPNQFPSNLSHGSLVSWTQSGILLLNIIQTIPRSTGTSHQGIGWERFTQVVLNLIDQQGGSDLQLGLVFLIWGENALNQINQSSIPSGFLALYLLCFLLGIYSLKEII